MKIVDIKTYVVGTPPPHHGGFNWVFLKLTTDGGIEGVGEAYAVPFHPSTVVRLIEDVGERYVIGSDPFKIERLWCIIYYSTCAQHPDLTMMDGLLQNLSVETSKHFYAFLDGVELNEEVAVKHPYQRIQA